MDIVDAENPKGVVVSVGGQIPNNLVLPLAAQSELSVFFFLFFLFLLSLFFISFCSFFYEPTKQTK